MNGSNWKRQQDRNPGLHLPGRINADTPPQLGIPSRPLPGPRMGSSRTAETTMGSASAGAAPRALPAWGSPAGAAWPLGEPAFLGSSCHMPVLRSCYLPHKGLPTYPTTVLLPSLRGFPIGLSREKVENGALLHLFSKVLVRISLCSHFGEIHRAKASRCGCGQWS